MDEAHVEHAVGFVEHEDLHVRQVAGALLVQVEQAARRGHEDVDALVQAVDLRLHADAAEDDHAGQRHVLAVGAHAFLDLGGEFAGGGEDQGANEHAALGILLLAVGEQPVQHRQHEAGGLAGAGLGAGEKVAALEDDGNGLQLDRGRGRVAVLVHCTQERLGEAEFVKVHGWFSVPVRAGNRGSACCAAHECGHQS